MSQLQKIGTHKTSIYASEGMTRVKYWATDVVSFNDSKIILDTGGYSTNTTKARMNQASNQFALGYQVYQKAFNWFVNYKGQTIPFRGDTLELDRNAEAQDTSEILDRVLKNA